MYRLTILSALAIATLFAGSAAAVDFSTNAVVDVVAGIVITETSPLDFGAVAKTNGAVSVATDGSLTDTSNIVFDQTSIAAGVLSIQANAGAPLTLSMAAGSTPAGLTLSAFKFSAAGGAEANSGDNHTMVADTDALLIGATLTVDGTAVAIAADVQLPYTVTAVYQ